MKRRSVIAAGLAGLISVPVRSFAQKPSAKIPRVGILTPADSERTPIFDAFRAGLHDLGYVEGRNIILEFRLARGDSSLLARLAAELVGMPVDVIVTDDDPALTGARDATRDIPIVIGATAIDPVLSGLVPSLSHPGGNITGFTLMMLELNAKRLELLRTAFPDITAVAILIDPSKPAWTRSFQPIEEAARALGLPIARVEAGSADALLALRPAAFSGASAVLVAPGAMFWNHRREIIALVNAARLPVIYPEREYADDGGLMAYGANVPDNFRRAAGYVDRILKGANPAELPIQQPTRFDFVVNLKTAKELDLTIPRTILARADEVIE
jgi:putative tryptophan/tyrosine transport system substrate-binding protein